MISFAHPAFLWGLTALALPLAIHLLSRKEGKVIYIGSLRHLQESNTRQTLSIRLNEVLLLILRMIVIALLVLYISGLQWQKSRAQNNWLLIEKGLEKNKKLTTVFDSLKENWYEAHFLSPGFPKLEDSTEVTAIVSYWDLAKAIQSRQLTNAITFSYNKVELFRGTRTPLPSEVQWIACDIEPHQFPVQGTSLSGGQAIIRTGTTTATSTRFETIKITDAEGNYFKSPNSSDSIGLTPPDTLRIWLPAEAPFTRDANVLLAALGSLQEVIPQTKLLIDSKPVLKKYDWIFQFVGESHSKISSDHRVIFKPSASASLFLQASVHEWQLTRRLTEGIALKENLSIKLCELLIPSKTAWAIAASNDNRSLDGSIAWAKTPSNNAVVKATLAPENTDQLLMTLMFLVILIERIISRYRNQ